MWRRAGCPASLFALMGDARRLSWALLLEVQAADFFRAGHASTARTPRRRPMYAASMACGTQCACECSRFHGGFCKARPKLACGIGPVRRPAATSMDPAACVARRTRSRRTEAKAAPRGAVARVSQSVEGPPSELRKPAVTQPDTNEEAAEDPLTTSAAAEPHAGGDARRASLDSASSAYSHDAFEPDALEAVLPSPRKSRARPRPKLAQFRLDAKCLKHFLSYLSPARLATCRQVSHDWRRVCSDDALWRPLVENFFPRGSHQLIRRLERQPRAAQYLRLYKLRLRLERAADTPVPRPDVLRGYSALVEIEVLRPDTGYSVVADWRPLRRGSGKVLICVEINQCVG